MKETPFLAYLAARTSIGLAGTMLSVTIGWHLYQNSGNPFDLALVGLMQILPMLTLFILAGWVVDHFPRRSVLMFCALAEAVVHVGLALAMMQEELNKFIIYTLLFVHGCSRTFYSPALQAILPSIVSREALPKSIAITSAAWTMASTVGPFAAGLSIAWLDRSTYWLLVGLSSLGASFFFCLPPISVSQTVNRGLKDLLSGIHFVWANPIVLPSITLDMVIVLLGSVVALLPVFAIDVLNVGPETLGLLRAMPALGGVMMGVLLAKLPPMRRAGHQLFIAFVIYAAAILVFGLSRNLWVSLLALWVYGASDMISVNIRNSLIQLATPDELRGRVSAVNMLFIYTSNELGDFRAGSVAALMSPVATVLSGAMLALVVSCGGCWLFPKLRRLDRVTDVAV